MKQYKLIWGEPIYIPDNSGDTWDPAWSDDDKLYVGSNDTNGFFKQEPRNVSFGVVEGQDIYNLTGKTVNNMDEYGKMGEKLDDNCTWKTCGCVSVEGVLYFVAGRHCYGNESGDPYKRQTTKYASIIKSEDKAKTWVPSSKYNYDNPMFEAPFSTPYFIHYGKDNETSFAPEEDEAGKYVYAISNNGFWDNGDYYILGRVEKTKLSNLNKEDWEYLISKDQGALVWGKNAKDACKIIENERKCGETGATYIKALNKYMLVAWYYNENGRDKPSDSAFIVYLADHPWGEWQIVGTKQNSPEGWYCPRAMAKFQSVDEYGTVNIAVCTGGDYTTGFGTGVVDYYKMSILPLKIKAE